MASQYVDWYNIMSTNCDVIAIFLIYDNAEFFVSLVNFSY